MAELNEDLQAQVKFEIDGKELTAAHKSMIFQKYGLQEPQDAKLWHGCFIGVEPVRR